MTGAISTGPVPPVAGLDKEEPELAYEDDIPKDEGTVADPTDPEKGSEKTPDLVEPDHPGH